MSEGNSPSSELGLKQDDLNFKPKKIVSIETHPKFKRYDNLTKLPYIIEVVDNTEKKQNFVSKLLNSRVKDVLSDVKNLPITLYDQAVVAIRYQLEQEFDLRSELSLVGKTASYLKFLTETTDKNPQLLGIGVAAGLSFLSIANGINWEMNPFYNNPTLPSEAAARLSATLGFSGLGYKGKTRKERVFKTAALAAGGFALAHDSHILAENLQHSQIPGVSEAVNTAGAANIENLVGFGDDAMTIGAATKSIQKRKEKS
jgi:hypothetical protein